MAGLFNQNNKTNWFVLILMLMVSFISFSIYSHYSYDEPYETLTLGIFIFLLIFGPALYGMYSQNIHKSLTFSVLNAFPFLWLALVGWKMMLKGDFVNNFYLFVGSPLLSFFVFLISGILTSWVSVTYEPVQIKLIKFGSYAIPVYHRAILIGMLLFSFIFLITGSMPFGIHLH
ncbi:hypothetical protein LJB85_03500 [Porphyromonadaceae bacterium OttesenSCG-928-L07]|nr:hypothetical protein [Porphyromonadaceae bacterium OttesenSCG-928-L07]